MPPSNPATTLRPSTAVKPNRSALHSVGIGTPPDPETNRSGNTIFSDPGPRCTCPFEKYGLAANQIKLVIDGSAGNDTLIGSNGNDTFAFSFGAGGHDTVMSFQTHGAGTQGDVIALAGFQDHSFDQALADGH